MSKLILLLLLVLPYTGSSQLHFLAAPPAQDYFTSTGYLYHDYIVSAAIGTAAQSNDVAFLDKTANGINGTPINGVLSDNYLTNNKPRGAFLDTGDDAINIGQSTALKTALRTDHEVHLLVAMDDGQIAATYELYGVLNTGGGYSACYVETNGKLNFAYATNATTNTVNWQSTATDVIPNGVTGLLVLRVRWDFTTDVVTVWKNGTAVPGSISSGTLSSVNPSLWDTSRDFLVGALNNAGSTTTNTNRITYGRFAVTPTAPDTRALDYFSNPIATDALWQSQIHVTASNASTIREALIDVVFPEGTLPTNATPATIASVSSGSIHGTAISTITNRASIDRWTFTRDGVSNKVYHIVSSFNNNKLVLYTIGHSPINDVLAVNTLLGAGYNVLYCAMARSGDAEDLSDNTVVAGPWTPVSGGNHNEMSTLNLNAFQYFLYDKIEAINYVKANIPAYTNIYVTGISGGGWTTVWLAALDERFEKSFPIRGYLPRIYKCKSAAFITPITAATDAEQGGYDGQLASSSQSQYDLYTTYTYKDLIALSTTSGRLSYTITHINDTAGLGGSTFYTWKATMQTLATTLSGTFNVFVNTNGGEAAHSIYADEIAIMMTQL